MARPLRELCDLAIEYQCPVICCGDIFDKWNSPPELINFAINHLPRPLYAIPGNHDLPLHNYTDVGKSAFWTLVEAGIVKPIKYNVPELVDSLALYGFPWLHEITPCKQKPMTLALHVAVAHKYVWTRECRFRGAPNDQRLSNYRKSLGGYDVALFGDNHIPFIVPPHDDKIGVINCGSLMTRTATELTHKRMVGLIHRDGRITPYFLDSSKDVYMDLTKACEYSDQTLEMTAFLEQLSTMGEATVDFGDAVNRFLSNSKVGRSIKKIILEALEGKHK